MTEAQRRPEPEQPPPRLATKAPAPAAPPAAPKPADLVRDPKYVAMLVLGAITGVPVAVASYFFLKAVSEGQVYFFVTLPKELGFQGEPSWWPVLPLTVSGALVALTIRYLPGTGGHSPSEGFKMSGPVPPIELPGIVLAALLTLCLGPVLGPEAPLIALGSGMGVLFIHLLRRDAPAMATAVVAAAGSFAAISVILGSPITGAFLLMEAAGLGGGLVSVVLLPGLLAAGIGSLVFVGLDHWVGFGTFSLSVSPIPHFGTPTGVEFLWAIGIGLAAAVVGTGTRRLALLIRPAVHSFRFVVTPLLGLGIAGLAIAFHAGSGRSSSQVLFSGQSALQPLITSASTWTLGALILLVVCKGLAYGLSLSGFRGGPTFPALFIGAAGGLACSHAPGLPAIAGAAIGIGAMSTVMLNLPLTSVLLVAVLFPADSLKLVPLVIVAVVVSYVASVHLMPPAPDSPAETPARGG